MSEIHIDATVFLGMHSTDDAIRLECKRLFVDRLRHGVVMNLEQVGYCDEVVWRFERTVQDAYFPFMDALHTEMPFQRVHYEWSDIHAAVDAETSADLSAPEQLAVAMTVRRGGTLCTVSDSLLRHEGLPVLRPRILVGIDSPHEFPAELEALYEHSLELRIDAGEPS